MQVDKVSDAIAAVASGDVVVVDDAAREKGLSSTRIKDPARRDRLLMLAAFAPGLQTSMKRVLRGLLALIMISAGVFHFLQPAGFVKIVPAFLPAPETLVHVSGVFEILGGFGILLRRTRYLGALGLMALFVAVLPANINMAVNDIQPTGKHVPEALLWLRLPLQVLLIAWAWWLRR